MGLNLHGINFLRFIYKRKAFGDVATLGRQSLHVNKEILKKIFNSNSDFGKYCEKLLIEHFDAISVDSYDIKGEENPTEIKDLGVKNIFQKKYDTVLDAGTLQYIFNPVIAIQNVINLCKVGGSIIHILPANNFCGRGYWQFSPEFFRALYTKEMGFDECQIFLADLNNLDEWYLVDGNRSRENKLISSINEVFVLVHAIKSSEKNKFDLSETYNPHDFYYANSDKGNKEHKSIPKFKKIIRYLILKKNMIKLYIFGFTINDPIIQKISIKKLGLTNYNLKLKSLFK